MQSITVLTGIFLLLVLASRHEGRFEESWLRPNFDFEQRQQTHELLMTQRDILRLLVNVHQPNRYQGIARVGNTYSIRRNTDRYEYSERAVEFLADYDQGSFLPRDAAFSAVDPQHMRQAEALFNMLLDADDFNSFFKTAAWARDRFNAGLFVYALSVAVLAREDTQHIVLPPPYEILPHLFISSEDMDRIYRARMANMGRNASDGLGSVVVRSSKDHRNCRRRERCLSYFTEDVGLNAFNTYFHYYHPRWFSTVKYSMAKYYRADLFLYLQRQLLARYHLERLSNHLPEMERFDWEQPELPGFYPGLSYHNGKNFPFRRDQTRVHDVYNVTVEKVRDYERRLRDALDQGYYKDVASEAPYSVAEYDLVRILGYILTDSVEPIPPDMRYYGGLFPKYLALFGQNPSNKPSDAPGALGHFETQLRDPAYYRIAQRIDGFFEAMQPLRKRYEPYDIGDNVKIESFKLDRLETYLDDFDVDMSTALGIPQDEVDIVLRQTRLNHRPFSYRVRLKSPTERDGVAMLFLGPTAVSDFDTQRRRMVELDRFYFTIRKGSSVLKRNSLNFTVTAKDPVSFRTLLRKVEDAIEHREQPVLDEAERQYGYPDRLVLPRGTKDGLPVTLYVMVTTNVVYLDRYAVFHHHSAPLLGLGFRDPTAPNNGPANGFPFDRPVLQDDLLLPNIASKDALVYHDGGANPQVETS